LVETTDTLYSDYDVEPGETHIYYVVAKNECGQSENSETDSTYRLYAQINSDLIPQTIEKVVKIGEIDEDSFFIANRGDCDLTFRIEEHEESQMFTFKGGRPLTSTKERVGLLKNNTSPKSSFVQPHLAGSEREPQDDIPWLDADPDNGTVSPSSSSKITVIFDASLYGAPDILRAELWIITNDPDSSRDTIKILCEMQMTQIKESMFTKYENKIKISPNLNKNGEFSITYWVRKRSEVKLYVVRSDGRVVAKLVEAIKNPGKHSLTWNPKNLGAGVYFVICEIGKQRFAIPIVLLK
jgi:hypothetical protein